MIKIRKEKAEDETAISKLLLAAFEDHPHSNNKEYLIVEALRKVKALTLSCVAVSDAGEVIGHIAFSPAMIDAEFTGWYTLAPLAVMPEEQGKGIGGSLVTYGLVQMSALGAKGCLLVGDPSYYEDLGFKSTPQLKAKDVPQENLLVYSFKDKPVQGDVTFHEAFLLCEC